MTDSENSKTVQTVSGDRIINGRLIEGAYAQDTELSEITVPEGVDDIGEVAFFGCTNLHRVVLPESLRVIREEAFGESGIEEIIIPEGVERIEEKAFFSCGNLRRIEVRGEHTAIGPDAFGDCRKLLEGYVARGYPVVCNPPEELLYTLLWCSCPDRHSPETSGYAEKFIRENEALIMERILKLNNTAAMNGLSRRKLLRQENINSYVAAANQNGQTELVALLLEAIDKNIDNAGEFEL